MTDHPHSSMHRFLEATVGEYMTRNIITVESDTSLGELEALFEKHDFNAFPVIQDGKVIGLVTKFDFLRAFSFTTSAIVPHYDDLMKRTVAEFMTREFERADPALPLTRVLQSMVRLRVRSLPVLDGAGRLLGMISREDIMRALRATTST